MRLLFFLLLFNSSVSCCQKKATQEPWMSKGLSLLASNVRPDFKIGAQLNPKVFLNEKDKSILFNIYKNEFNIISVTSNMPGIQKKQGVFDFKSTDECVNFANQNKLIVSFQPLIAGDKHTSPWIVNGGFTSIQLHNIMEKWIDTMLNRYRGKVEYIDVVNEALLGLENNGDFKWNTDNNVWMNMGWYQGKHYKFPKYLIEGYKIAKEIGGGDFKYIYNQWGNATTKSKMGDACLKLYLALKEEGIILDGMGIQLHCAIKDEKLFEQPGGQNNEFDFASFDQMLSNYARVGLPVHITEFDIALSEFPTEAEFNLQGKYFAQILKHSIQSKAVKTFKTWGATDKYSWVRKSLPYPASPLLYDTLFMPKPAIIEQKRMLFHLKKG